MGVGKYRKIYSHTPTLPHSHTLSSFYMEVTVRLFANLRKYLPPDSDGKKVVLKVPEGITVREVASSLKIPEQFLQIVLVNGNNASLDQRLSEGDELSIFPFMAGGTGQHV